MVSWRSSLNRGDSSTGLPAGWTDETERHSQGQGSSASCSHIPDRPCCDVVLHIGAGLLRPRRCAEQHRSKRSEEHTSELQSQSNLVCRLLLEKKKSDTRIRQTPSGMHLVQQLIAHTLCLHIHYFLFFFNDTATTEIYTLSLHDALPISHKDKDRARVAAIFRIVLAAMSFCTSARASCARADVQNNIAARDRKSTRLNSSHSQISYAVFCLKKKKVIHVSVRLPAACILSNSS